LGQVHMPPKIKQELHMSPKMQEVQH